MTPQEKANKLVSMNEVIVLAETGYKLPADERKGIAKRQAIETCNEVLGYIFSDHSFWVEVKEELEKL